MDFRKGEIIAIDKPYRMSSFGALAHVRYLLSKKLGFKVKIGMSIFIRSTRTSYCRRKTSSSAWSTLLPTMKREADLEAAIQKGRRCGMKEEEIRSLFELIMEDE